MISHIKTSIIVFMLILLTAFASGCDEQTENELGTAAVQVRKTIVSEAQTTVKSTKGTVVSEGKRAVATQIVQLRQTAQARLATVQSPMPSPWDTNWIPSDTPADSLYVTEQIDKILSGTGLEGQGESILKYSKEYGVNPAFALAMFMKEASFARPGTRAYRNNNPGNIIATGDCRGKPKGSLCIGHYGEVSTDGRFGVYESMSDGIKAYFWLLANEYKPGTRRNCSDIRCIISAYCPPSECDTDKYVSQIVGWTKKYQQQIITLP